MFWKLFVLVCLWECRNLACASIDGTEHGLHKALIERYPSVYARPVFNHTETVRVQLGLALIQLNELDEQNHLLSIVGWMRLAWTDILLTWNPDQYGGLSQTRMSIEDIWSPDIVPYNSRSPVEHLHEAQVVVDSSGYVLVVKSVQLQTSCSMDMTNFPFDEQVCQIKLGSWTYSGFEVDVSHFSNLEDIDLNDYIRHHEWRVVKTYARRNVKYYPCCVEPYLDITYTLILKREGGRFVPMLVAPAVMMSLLLPVMFVLPVESGEKMTLGIGILLVIVLMLDTLNEYIMTSFSTMPLLVSYYIACLILTSISLALSACVVNVAHSKRRMPAWLRKLVLKPLTCVFCVWGTNEEPQLGQAIRFRQQEPEPLDDLSQPSDDRQRFAPSAGQGTVTPIAVEEWRRLATALDRLLFCVFLLIDIIMMVCLLPRALN